MDVVADSVDVTTYFVLRLAADGTEATGLTITNLDLQYTRSGSAPTAKVDATALAATDSAHADWKAIEIDATDQPGLYRVDWPDAAFAAGVREVILSVKCATCFTEHLRVNLTAVPANVTHFGGSAGTFASGIPAVNAAQVSGDSTAADTLELFAEALDQATGQLDSGSLADGTITAAAIATGAIDADAIADNAIDAGALAADCITAAKVAADVTTEIQSGLATAAELAKVPKSDSNVTWNATAAAQIQSEATDALNAYDPPTRTEATADKDEIVAYLAGLVVQKGTIGATGNDTTHIHINGVTYGDDEINNYLLVIRDVSEGEWHARYIEDFTATGDLATVATLPFTPEASVDLYVILAFRQDVTGGAGLDAAGVRAAIGLASANLDTQLGTIDSNVDSILADTNELQTDWTDGGRLDLIVDGILTDTAEIGAAGAGLTNINLPNQTMDIVGNITGNLSGSVGSVTGAVGSVTGNVGGNVTGSVGSVATGGITAGSIAADAIGASELAADAASEIATAVRTELATELARVDVAVSTRLASSTTGSGFSAIPWNAAWDAEVQSEVQDALEANNLDRLVKIAVDTDFATTVHLDSVIGQLAQTADGGFSRATDSQEAIRDRGDAAWITATGFSTLDAAGVRSAVGLASANLDTQLDALPTNAELATALAAADDAVLAAIAALNNLSAAQVNAEVDAALADVGLTTTVTGRIDVAVSTRLASSSYTAPLDAAGVRAALGLASANLDTQLSTIDTVVDAILDDTGTSGVALTAAERNATADAILGRSVANCEATAAEWSLCSIVLATLESSISGTTWTIKRTNGSTTHLTKAVTVDADADPITGVQ